MERILPRYEDKSINWCYKFLHSMIYKFPHLFDLIINKVTEFMNKYHRSCTIEWIIAL